MSKYLFVGGPKDAERLEIPDDAQYWKFAEMKGITWEDYMNPFKDQCVDILEYVYKKHSFYGKDGSMWYAFLYKDIDVMEMLLNGYRKGKRKSKKKPKIYLT
jgi:hypothetical protein